MNFKMAEGSLFAILLRSGWWWSALIAGVIIMITVATVGSTYLVFGIAAALPFIGIAGMAAFRQSKRPSKKQVQEIVENALALPARELSTKVAAAYERDGFEVIEYKGKGADLDLTKGWRRILVSSKRFKAASIGIEQLKVLNEAVKREEATGCVFVGLGELSDAARKYAIDNNIEIVGSEPLAMLLTQPGAALPA